MHKVFISYHHGRDQFYKEQLVRFNTIAPVFIDRSVDTSDISDDLDDQAIREKIRDEYLRDSTVTIMLVGQETQKRKHVDWEIYSSMFDGAVNKRSGNLVVLLPDANPQVSFHAAHESEKATVYPEYKTWVPVTTEAEFRRRYPLMPDRLIDNLVARDVKISVTGWAKIDGGNFDNLTLLIDNAYRVREQNAYGLHRPMRRADS